MLIADEAHRHGFVEGIALDHNGLISEGSGENIFVVRDGVLYTPPAAASILMGITRDSVITLAKSLGIDVREQTMPREMLYVADEAFFTGTAAEITPIRSVDGISVGRGEPGGVTRSLQRAFFGLFTGETRDRWGWLDPIEEVHVHVAGTNGTSGSAHGGAAASDRPRRTARARWPTEPCPW